MKKYLFLMMSLSFLTFSCTNQDEDLMQQPEANYTGDKIVVLKERDPDNPWVPSDYQSIFSLGKRSIGINQEKYLGMSYKSIVFPFEDTRNLGNQVIDYAKFRRDYETYFKSWKVNNGEAFRFSYATFDNYTSNSKKTTEVSGGFNLNLGVFSVGNKKSRTETFSKSLVENNNAVFGELNVVVRDSVFNLQLSSYIKEKIKKDYMHKDFLAELYNTHPSEFFHNYGGFVLTNYVTGGKATALYTGIYKKTETTATKEANMNREINASYTFDVESKNDGSVSGNLKIGKNSNNSISITNEFSSIMMSVKAFGGDGSFAAFTPSSEMKNTNIDLSNWLTSLSDKRNSTIIEFGQNGLIPITEFIPEYNLKIYVKKYMDGEEVNIKQLREPYISIRVYPQSTGRFDFDVTLVSRFANVNNFVENESKIFLKSGSIYPPFVSEFLAQEVKRYSSMFQLRMEGNIVNIPPPPSNEIIPFYNNVFFDEPLLKKCIHNGVIYIVSDYIPTLELKYEDDWSPVKVYHAYSIHDNRLLDEYGIRALVNRLPTTNISFETLMSKYRIYAL